MFCWRAGVADGAVKFASDGQRRVTAAGFHGVPEVHYKGQDWMNFSICSCLPYKEKPFKNGCWMFP